MLSRKEFFRLAAGAGLLLTTGCASAGGANTSSEGSAGAVRRSALALPEPFRMPLPVPPVLKPVRSDDSTDYYSVTQQAVRRSLLPGVQTEIWGYDGIFPGPTLSSVRGRRVVVTHRNALPVPTVVHLHGGRTPAEHDGYPTDTIAPAGSRDYAYPLDQPAATLWYHDHRKDFTGPQVYKGLAGFHIHRDDHELSLGLPSGERDVPLMITDRSFRADGSFDYPSLDPSLLDTPGVTSDAASGVLGDCILVNGVPWPVLEVSNTRHRFRILNASNARRYELALDPARTPFVQIGSDQGLLCAPVAHQTLPVAQAERFDVVIDFSAYSVGDRITLRNLSGSGSTADVLRFVVTSKAADHSVIPAKLADLPVLRPSDAVVTRDLVFARGASMRGMAMWTINGQPFDPNRIDVFARLGTVERWRVRAQNVEHPIHVHLAAFQALSVDGGVPAVGWKDTVNLDSGGRADLLLRFDRYPGRYVFHCHNLEHEDMMMMGNIQVG
jgi:spore coat protein A